jgi:hypothetical protein
MPIVSKSAIATAIKTRARHTAVDAMAPPTIAMQMIPEPSCARRPEPPEASVKIRNMTESERPIASSASRRMRRCRRPQPPGAGWRRRQHSQAPCLENDYARGMRQCNVRSLRRPSKTEHVRLPHGGDAFGACANGANAFAVKPNGSDRRACCTLPQVRKTGRTTQ